MRKFLLLPMLLYYMNLKAQDAYVINKFVANQLNHLIALDRQDTCFSKMGYPQSFTFKIQKKEGYYFNDIQFLLISENERLFCPNSFSGNILTEYIVAIMPHNRIFRLKGFTHNDYIFFMAELLTHNGGVLKRNKVLKEYFVEGLDFRCLDKAFRELVAAPQRIQNIKYECKCLVTRSDMYVIH